MKHDMNNSTSTNNTNRTNNDSVARLTRAAGALNPLDAGTFELDADLATVTAQLDRLAASDRGTARAGFELRLAQVAADAARASHLASQKVPAASDAPAPISIAAARQAAADARRVGSASTSSWSLGSPLRIAAGLGLVAAVLGTLLAQRGTGTNHGTNIANNDGNSGSVPTATIATNALTPADVELGEVILDEIFPVTLASLESDTAESAARAEFWSLDAFAEDSL